MLKKLIAAAVATAALAAVYPAEAQEGSSYVLKRIKERGVVNMGHREASVPFAYIGPDGDPIGYSMDICNMFVDKIREQTYVERKGIYAEATRAGLGRTAPASTREAPEAPDP